jgi:putative membrane protein
VASRHAVRVLADSTHASSYERYANSDSAIDDGKQHLEAAADADILEVAATCTEPSIGVGLAVTTVDTFIQRFSLRLCASHPNRQLELKCVKRYHRPLEVPTSIPTSRVVGHMQTQTWAREHVPALTAALTAVSLALVFGAVLQVLPVEALPQPEALLTAIPHLNAVVSLLAIGTIVVGVRSIRDGNVERHRRFMLTSFVLFALFLTLYLYRVALLGPSGFSGPDVVYTYVYLPVLFVHIALAIVCVPFVFYALLVAGTRPVADIYETRHRTAGRVAAGLWTISFSMGLLIYAMLYLVY